MMTLPRKVWRECYECPKFPHCGEVAMVLSMDAYSTQRAEPDPR